jgi:hypothetical protein
MDGCLRNRADDQGATSRVRVRMRGLRQSRHEAEDDLREKSHIRKHVELPAALR